MRSIPRIPMYVKHKFGIGYKWGGSGEGRNPRAQLTLNFIAVEFVAVPGDPELPHPIS